MIYILEPQCYGVEHSLGNAAFLHLLLEIYPHEKICFYAEKSHLIIVKKVALLEKVEYVDIEIPL